MNGYLTLMSRGKPFIKLELILNVSIQYVECTPIIHPIDHLILVKISHKNIDDHQSS